MAAGIGICTNQPRPRCLHRLIATARVGVSRSSCCARVAGAYPACSCELHPTRFDREALKFLLIPRPRHIYLGKVLWRCGANVHPHAPLCAAWITTPLYGFCTDQELISKTQA